MSPKVCQLLFVSLLFKSNSFKILRSVSKELYKSTRSSFTWTINLLVWSWLVEVFFNLQQNGVFNLIYSRLIKTECKVIFVKLHYKKIWFRLLNWLLMKEICIMYHNLESESVYVWADPLVTNELPHPFPTLIIIEHTDQLHPKCSENIHILC